MTDTVSSASPEFKAERLILERMGIAPRDLLASPASRPAVPTFAEYIPTVPAAISDGSRYGCIDHRA